jgi:hypothetical protein
MIRLAPLAATLAWALACGAPEAPSGEGAATKCPRVHLDKLAGDWVSASGDAKVRFRVVERDGKTLLWLTDPGYSNQKLELLGRKREKDWQFDEIPRGRRKRLLDAQAEVPKRVYVQPRPQRCAVEVYAGVVGADGREQVGSTPREFLQFPEPAPVELSFAPFDEVLYVGEAAARWSVAEAEVAALGEPRYEVPMGRVSVTAWSDPAADGDPACTYTLDAWFDDQRVTGGSEVAVGAAIDGRRPWTYTFEAPYTGNHRFELHRYRSCGGGPRELLAVAGTDAVLL